MRNGNRTLHRAAWCSSRAAWLLVLVLGCTGQQGAQWRDDQEVVQELPILWEASGTWSHVTRPVRIVAYDAATLAQVPVADVPVDFDSQMVLIAALGPTLGQDVGIKIARVWREDRRHEHELHVVTRRHAERLRRASRVEGLGRCEQARDVTEQALLTETACTAMGAEVYAARCDVRDRGSVERFLAERDLSSGSLRIYRLSLVRVGDHLPAPELGAISPSDLSAALGEAYPDASPASWNRHVATLRSFCAWAQRRGLLAEREPREGPRPGGRGKARLHLCLGHAVGLGVIHAVAELVERDGP